VNIVHHSYRMLFIAVSIKKIVDMSDNKQFVKTRAQPPSQVAVAKTRYATRRPGYINSFIYPGFACPNKLRHITHARHTRSRHVDVRAAKYIKLSPFSTSLEPSFSNGRGSLNFLSVHSCSQNLPLISCMSA